MSVRVEPGHLRLGAEVHRPRPGHARRLAEQMAARGEGRDVPGRAEAAAALDRADLLDA